MCCFEYNLKAMSKKSMAELIRNLVKDKEVIAERAQSYKKQMLEYENFANKRMYKLDKDNNDLTVENIKLKEENSYLKDANKAIKENAAEFKKENRALTDAAEKVREFNCELRAESIQIKSEYDQLLSDYEDLSKRYCELKKKHNTFMEELVDHIKVDKQNTHVFEYKPGEKPHYKMTKEEEDEWNLRCLVSNACNSMEKLVESTRKLAVHMQKRAMYLANPKTLKVPLEFMLDDARFEFPFLQNERVMALDTCRTNVIRIVLMYGKSYYYDFNRQSLTAINVSMED